MTTYDPRFFKAAVAERAMVAIIRSIPIPIATETIGGDPNYPTVVAAMAWKIADAMFEEFDQRRDEGGTK